MTSFAFILGVLPLVFAIGAGAASRRALGTAVFGGMNAATLLAIFIVPVLFVVMERFRPSGQGRGTRLLCPADGGVTPVHSGARVGTFLAYFRCSRWPAARSVRTIAARRSGAAAISRCDRG